MASQPSEGNIQLFLDFTGLDRASAIAYLRGTNNDVEQAVNSFFANEPPKQPTQNTWSEGDWGKERDGTYGQENIPSFQIDIADDMPQYSGVAPSRPPSRNSTHSNVQEVATSGRSSGMEIDAPAQETGVVGQDGKSSPFFGPATRSHYETNDWALTTLTGHTVTETLPDPPASSRTREPGQISFLKPSLSNDYLPALLTILNAIPLTHNTLLLASDTIPDYGYDSEWWKGSSIKPAGTPSAESESEANDQIELIRETQRLMAFLDMTDRSYGSAEALCQLKALADISRIGQDEHLDLTSDLGRFLAAWENAATLLDTPVDIPNVLKTTASVSDQRHKFWVLPATLGQDSLLKPQSLYDVLDAKMFIEEWPNIDEDVASITDPAKVFILRLKQPDTTCDGLDLDIPATWYADRYLKENLPATRPIRHDMARSKALVRYLEERTRELTRYDCRGKSIDPIELIQASMKAFRARTSEEKEVFPRDSEAEAEQEERQNGILKQLQAALDSVREKLEDLKTHKEQALKQLHLHSHVLTEVTENSKTSPKFRYRLRGVATKPNITYVLQHGTEAIARDEGWHESAQWWKIECRTQDTPYFEFLPERVTQTEVLRAAKSDSKDVLLIYANDVAIDEEVHGIPTSLEKFIRRDNRTFGQEIVRAQAAASQSMEDLTGSNDSQEMQHPPSYDFSQSWSQGTYTFQKGKSNTTTGYSSAERSSSGSDPTIMTPDTEMTVTEMKEREGSSLVATMAEDTEKTTNDVRVSSDADMMEMSFVDKDRLEENQTLRAESPEAAHIEDVRQQRKNSG